MQLLNPRSSQCHPPSVSSHVLETRVRQSSSWIQHCPHGLSSAPEWLNQAYVAGSRCVLWRSLGSQGERSSDATRRYLGCGWSRSRSPVSWRWTTGRDCSVRSEVDLEWTVWRSRSNGRSLAKVRRGWAVSLRLGERALWFGRRVHPARDPQWGRMCFSLKTDLVLLYLGWRANKLARFSWRRVKGSERSGRTERGGWCTRRAAERVGGSLREG